MACRHEHRLIIAATVLAVTRGINIREALHRLYRHATSLPRHGARMVVIIITFIDVRVMVSTRVPSVDALRRHH